MDNREGGRYKRGEDSVWQQDPSSPESLLVLLLDLDFGLPVSTSTILVLSSIALVFVLSNEADSLLLLNDLLL